ncbi:MAG: AmpG family muropeptide MFS transporter [Proteobacteria bacterium]|nr:AmpG family muropeptide MFS transporter [Pseudomonadota bacterium]MDA1308101.1 AmpG family muropeptide MFS transporter [Pseudomonadota bacterium]
MAAADPVARALWLLRDSITPYLKRRVIVVLLLGFASGLPLLLSFGTLSAWLREADVERTAIGLFALVGLPYALKPLWAPLMDGVEIPVLTRMLGRRRGWMVLSQAMLIVAIVGLATSDPRQAPLLMAGFAVLVAFFSASQDIVIDAYRIETLEDDEQGIGAAAVTYGYRTGMLVAGAGALILADSWTWTHAYLAMAALVLIGTVTVLLSPEPLSPALLPQGSAGRRSFGRWMADFVVAPFSEFATRPGWLVILLFIVTFKLGDAFLSIMTNPFYIDLGFTKTEIAEVTKLFGLIALAVGLFIGGLLIKWTGLLNALLISGVLQAASNFMFAYQAVSGNDLTVLTFTIGVENVTGGMGTAAFVAYLSSLTNTAFTATQYALLSAFTAFGRTLLSAPSGYLVDHVGWFDFFIVSVGVAVPGLILLLVLMRFFPDHAGRRGVASTPEAALKTKEPPT